MDVDPGDAAARIAAALTQAGVPSAIGGALCLAYWGVPRATKDLDLNVFVGDDALEPVFAALQAAGCKVDRAASTARARERGDFVAAFGPMRVDVFVSFHDYHREVAGRVVRDRLPDGTEAAFLSAEDLCVFKMLFHRAKDLVDLDRLFAARGAAIDIGYVERWLATLLGPGDGRVAEVRDRFDRVRAGAGGAG